MGNSNTVPVNSSKANNPQLPALTSLRIFAAFHVASFHMMAFNVFSGPEAFRKFATIGNIELTFFFVLSGFIMVYTHADRPLEARKFWRARFARIYPAYAFALLISFPLFYRHVFNAHDHNAIFDWDLNHFKLACALTIGLLQSWVPPAALSWNLVCWSLSVETFFYAIFPFLLGAFVKRSKPQLFAIVALCWLAGLAMSSAYVHLQPDGIEHPDFNSIAFWIQVLKFNPLVRLPEFLTGMALGLLFLRGERDQKWALPLVLVGAVGIGVAAYFAEQIPYVVINTGLLAPAFAAIVYGFALRPRWSMVLENRFLVLCGDASYSFYLLHTMIILALFHRVANGALQNTWLGFFLCQAITLGAALLVCQFIEKPVRERLLRRRRPPVAIRQAVDTT